jgi:hypothetical protein
MMLVSWKLFSYYFFFFAAFFFLAIRTTTPTAKTLDYSLSCPIIKQ